MESEKQVLVFTLGEKQYGLPAGHILRVTEKKAVSKSPLSPPYLRGIFNYRNHVIPLLDLGYIIGQNAEAEYGLTVVSQGMMGRVSYMVSSIYGIRSIEGAKKISTEERVFNCGLKIKEVIQIGPKEPFITILED